MCSSDLNQERVVIKGSDYDMMQVVAEDIRYYLDAQEFVGHAWMPSAHRQPEMRLHFDPLLLASYGITRSHIATGLAQLTPEYATGTTFKVGNKTYDIVIREDLPDKTSEREKKQQTVDDLKEVRIADGQGGMHRLHELATLHKSNGRSRIIHVN